jgi:hypothetical protein
MSNPRLLGGRRPSIVIPPLQSDDEDESYALQQAEALRLEKLIAEVSALPVAVAQLRSQVKKFRGSRRTPICAKCHGVARIGTTVCSTLGMHIACKMQGLPLEATCTYCCCRTQAERFSIKSHTRQQAPTDAVKGSDLVLGRVLGRGACSYVQEARHRTTHTLYAVKVRMHNRTRSLSVRELVTFVQCHLRSVLLVSARVNAPKLCMNTHDQVIACLCVLEIAAFS